MADPITRLNAALQGRYRIESELGERGMARRVRAADGKRVKDEEPRGHLRDIATVEEAPRTRSSPRVLVLCCQSI